MKYLATIILTIGATVGGIMGYLYGQGNIDIQRQEQAHSKQIIIDGVVTEDSSWTEFNGYNVSVNLVDGLYFGK